LLTQSGHFQYIMARISCISTRWWWCLLCNIPSLSYR